MNIGSIVWPTDGRAAIKLYLGFLIKVIEALGIKFSSAGPDPLAATKSYIAGSLPEDEYRSSANVWWGYLDGAGATRDLESEDALNARIAICLLSVTLDDVEDLGEHLSWFFEVLEQLGIDLDMPIDMMAEYFTFED
jgi:hypothetical protein